MSTQIRLRFGALLLFVFSLIAQKAISQTMEISNPTSGQPACPGIPITYDVNPTANNTSVSGCQYNWTIRGGVVAGTTQTTAISKTVTVIWNNIPTSTNNPTDLSVAVTSCSNTTLITTVPKRVVVRSLSTTTPAAITLSGGSSPTWQH